MKHYTLPFTRSNYNILKASRYFKFTNKTFDELEASGYDHALFIDESDGRLGAYLHYIPSYGVPYNQPKFNLRKHK